MTDPSHSYAPRDHVGHTCYEVRHGDRVRLFCKQCGDLELAPLDDDLRWKPETSVPDHMPYEDEQ